MSEPTIIHKVHYNGYQSDEIALALPPDAPSAL